MSKLTTIFTAAMMIAGSALAGQVSAQHNFTPTVSNYPTPSITKVGNAKLVPASNAVVGSAASSATVVGTAVPHTTGTTSVGCDSGCGQSTCQSGYAKSSCGKSGLLNSRCGSGKCGSRFLSGGHFFNGGHFSELKEKMDYYSAINSRISQRNDAWPKPFACYDKQAYHDIWSPMLARGNDLHCVLSAQFFDPNSNELNRLGIAKVSGIMTYLASSQKAILVQRTNDESINDARLASINSTLETYYSHLGTARVELSNLETVAVNGRVTESLNTKRMDNLPPPVITVGTGTSVNAAVGGN